MTGQGNNLSDYAVIAGCLASSLSLVNVKRRVRQVINQIRELGPSVVLSR